MSRKRTSTRVRWRNSSVTEIRFYTGRPEAGRAGRRCAVSQRSRRWGRSGRASSAVRGRRWRGPATRRPEWSSPPIGPSPSSVGRPAAAVVFASLAPPVAASCSSNPSSRGDARWPAPPAVRWRVDFSIGGWPARLPDARRRRRPRRGRRRSARPPPTPRRTPRRLRRAGRAARGTRRPRRSAACRRDHARVQRDARPAAVERVEGHHRARRGQDRRAPLLRLHAGMRRAAGEGQLAGPRSPCARRRCRRWRGRTRAPARRRARGTRRGCAAC